MPALIRFAKEKRKEDLKTTVDRPQLIKDIENYANQSEENKEMEQNMEKSQIWSGAKHEAEPNMKQGKKDKD